MRNKILLTVSLSLVLAACSDEETVYTPKFNKTSSEQLEKRVVLEGALSKETVDSEFKKKQISLLNEADKFYQTQIASYTKQMDGKIADAKKRQISARLDLNSCSSNCAALETNVASIQQEIETLHLEKQADLERVHKSYEARIKQLDATYDGHLRAELK